MIKRSLMIATLIKSHAQKSFTKGSANMPSTPMFRAIHLLPYVDFCKKNGLSVPISFKKFKLPSINIDCFRDESVYLPQIAACNAVEDIGKREGVLDLAVRSMGDLKLADYGAEIESMIHYSPTLHIAIEKLKRVIQLEDASLTLGLTIRENNAYLTCESNAPLCNSSAWGDLLLMINVIRSFSTAEWTPAEIYHPIKNQSTDYIQAMFPHTRFYWHPTSTGISFPTRFLTNKGRYPINIRECVLNRSEVDFIGPEQTHHLKGLISAYLNEGGITVDFMSELLGVSTRALQRSLRSFGTSYSELVDQVRIEKATQLMQDYNRKTLSIALDTGYSSHSHFSRAFKRITNLTPKEYRQLSMNKVEEANC